MSNKMSTEATEEYERRAAAALKPLRDAGLSKYEIAMLLGERLRRAADVFAQSHGSADAWNVLYALMCAVQVNGNPEK